MCGLAGVPLAGAQRGPELHCQPERQELQSLHVPSKGNRAQTKPNKCFLKVLLFLSCLPADPCSSGALVAPLADRGPFRAKWIGGEVHPHTAVHVLSDCSYFSIIFVLAAFVSADHVRPEKALFF